MQEQKTNTGITTAIKALAGEPFIKNYILLLCFYAAIFGLLRVIFFIAMNDGEHYSAMMLLHSLFLGLRMDLAVTAFMTAPAYILAWLGWLCLPRQTLWRRVGQCYTALLNIVLCVLLMAEFPLYNETRTKLNILAISFFKWPAYMTAQILGAVHIYRILPPLLILLFFAAKWSAEAAGRVYTFGKRPAKQAAAAFFITLAVACFFMRGNFFTRPIAPQNACFSENDFLNQTTANGIYNLAYELDFFPFKPAPQPFDVRDAAKIITAFDKNYEQSADDIFRLKPYEKPNIVLVMMESFASHIGALGDSPSLSPYFDEFSKNGILFTSFYANSIGSGRALISTVSSFPFPPIVDNLSTIKAPSLATYLKPYGYKSMFFCISGKEENMTDYLRNNGFNETYDDQALKQATGARSMKFDNELFDAADTVMQRTKQPFLSVIFTVTNHNALDTPPAIFPGDKTDKRTLSFRYADWALVRYLEKAAKSNYFKNTIFVLVADHTPRYFSDMNARASKFRIPLLVYSPLITNPHRDARTASQMDIAPTILRLCKVPVKMSDTSFFGTSLFERRDHPAAYFSNEELAFFGLVTPGQTYISNLTNEDLTPFADEVNNFRGDADKGREIFYAKALLHATEYFYNTDTIADWQKYKAPQKTP
jgi:phosphoglycerol transferase MdoB-like AlkP superfamily enzyme